METPTGAGPELIVDVDVNDDVWLRDHKMTEQDVKTLAAQLKQNGCQTLIHAPPGLNGQTPEGPNAIAMIELAVGGPCETRNCGHRRITWR
jgi:hypothetical protein